MQAILWVISGLIAGWLARVSMKGRHTGFLVDFTLGILGGICGSWILRSLGGSAPAAGSASHIVVSVLGAMVLVGAARILTRFTRQVQRSTKAAAPVIPDLEGYLRRLGKVERRVFNALLRRQTVARNAAETFNEQLTLGERTADRVAEFGGSWTFLGLFAAFMLGWILLNSGDNRPFDPYPYILLNLMLSCLAAVQAPVIMMSQNRQAAKDRFEAQQDYHVNLKAEMEVMALHVKLDEARESELKALLQLQNQQMILLEGLKQRLETLEQK
jgi:uncharacterized membrane protein/uncharacterized membrane protein YeaQ/YmgE (transglycosylase-associated protein family)